MKIKAYLHSSKETMFDKGEEAGLSGEALDTFKYALTEVEFLLDVNEQTGIATILKVDGKRA